MRRVVQALLCSSALLWPQVSQAGGLEIAGTGARGLARGGATLAKAEDPNVLAHNPAGLAELRGTMMLGDLNVTRMDACVEPIGYYGWGVYRGGKETELLDPDTGDSLRLQLGALDADGEVQEPDFYNDPLDTVCMDHAPFPVPQFGITHRVSHRLGLGFGLVFPSITPSGRWGGDNGIIRGDDGALRPSPVRYMQLSSGNVGVFPTVGAGYRISDMVRVGVALQWGILSVHQQVMAPVGGGTAPHNDVVADVRGVDWFVPAATASVHLVPLDALDVVGAFEWQDRLRATGELDATTGLFDPNKAVRHTRDLRVRRLTQGLPWKASLGMRYAARLAPRADGTGAVEGDDNRDERVRDAMSEEAWDVELDVEYQINTPVQSVQLRAASGQRIEFEDTAGTVAPVDYPVAGLEVQTIEKNWQNQWSLQLGGSYNLLPGVLALHAGANYETRGVDPRYMNVDFWPLQRVGLHGGVSVRIDRRIDLTFAYGHIMQEDLAVAAPPHGSPQDGAISKVVGTPSFAGGLEPLQERNAPVSPDGTAALQQEITVESATDPPTVVNSGIYRSHIDVLAVGLLYHF